MEISDLFVAYNKDAAGRGWLDPFKGGAGAFFATAMEVGWNRVDYTDLVTAKAQESNNAPMRYTLERIDLPKHGYLLGFAGAANLDIAVANKGITGIIIGAPDPGQAHMWEDVIAHLKEAPDRQSFLRLIQRDILSATQENYNTGTASFYFDLSPRDNTFYTERLKEDGRFLSSEEDYQKIRAMALADRIHIARLDLLNPEACQHLQSSVLAQLDSPIVAVQTSNILLHYALKSGKGYLGDEKASSFDEVLEAYHQNLRTLTGTEKVLAITADLPEQFMPGEMRKARHSADDPDPSRFRPPSPVMARAIAFNSLDALHKTHQAVLGGGRVWNNIPSGGS